MTLAQTFFRSVSYAACFLLGFSITYGKGIEFNGGAQKLPLIIAHRGASYDAPENTLKAFELAWEQGADGIEGDFFLTKDKKIVCFHDANTKRRTGVNKVVEKSTLAELQALDVGAWKGEAFIGMKMPTLQDVIKTVPKGKKIIIEIKSNAVIIPYLCEILESSALEADQILVLSFDALALKRLKEVAPQYQTTWAVGFRRDIIGRVSPSIKNVLLIQQKVKSDGVSSGSYHLPKGLSKELRKRGVAHHVWTVNNVEQARSFITLDSITTDIPGMLRKGLQGSRTY